MNYYNASGQMDLSDRIAIETGICIGESFKKIKVFLLLARLWLRNNGTAPRIPEQAVRPRQRKEREDSP